MASEKQRMLAGELYNAADPELVADRRRAAELSASLNGPGYADELVRARALKDLLATVGAGCEVRPPLHVDYGYNVHVGARTFVNFGAIMLDVASIVIGDDVEIGPSVQLLTAEHPIQTSSRQQKLESGRPIHLGDNVWLGGGVIVTAGVSIGPGTVVGAGSVVINDLPENVVAVGSPARVVRTIGDH